MGPLGRVVPGRERHGVHGTTVPDDIGMCEQLCMLNFWLFEVNPAERTEGTGTSSGARGG